MFHGKKQAISAVTELDTEVLIPSLGQTCYLNGGSPGWAALRKPKTCQTFVGQRLGQWAPMPEQSHNELATRMLGRKATNASGPNYHRMEERVYTSHII